MVLDKELQLDLVEHAAMLQNKAMIQNNVLAKRKVFSLIFKGFIRFKVT